MTAQFPVVNGMPYTIGPAFRAVDQLSGDIADQAAENARLTDENTELRCRVDELIDERDIMASALSLAVEQRDTALYERDTARAELAACR